MVVAVKWLKHETEHTERDFLAEVSSISQIWHKNLVQLLGWCQEETYYLLVFDYVSNGVLNEWLFPALRHFPNDVKYQIYGGLLLPWELHFSIIADIVAALKYLHEDWMQCVLHSDIKSSNVMLNINFNLHLGDFGLAELMEHEPFNIRINIFVKYVEWKNFKAQIATYKIINEW